MKPKNYQCRKCGSINQITTLWSMFITPHLGWRKWLKCKHCGAKRHFQRRVFQPEMNIREELKGTYEVIAQLPDVEVEVAKKIFADIDMYMDDNYVLDISPSQYRKIKKKYKVDFLS